MTGSEIVLEALKREKVDTIFAYPGGAVIPLFDALYEEESIRLILTRHEQAAVHAADGYARSTGRTGVCIVTSGPGATNTVTGLATANFDSVPLVCISGQVPRGMIGNDAFQEADTVGITRPVTKHNYLVTETDKLGRILKESFFIAGSGKPGPVVVDIPKDVLTGTTDLPFPEEVDIRGYTPQEALDTEALAYAVEALNRAHRPLLFVGGGVVIAEAQTELAQLVDATGVPVVTTLMGIGALPADHIRNYGMIGMHGSYAANMAVQSCDLLVGIGVRFDDRATGKLESFAPRAEIIHIDIDPTAIARNVPVSAAILGDAKETLKLLGDRVSRMAPKEWIEELSRFQNHYRSALSPHEMDSTLLSAERVIRALGEAFPEAVISTEVGQNQMWAAQYFPFSRPRSWLTSGGLGTMGYGFPAAVGAQAGNPERRVIDIAGDGSIQMNIQELATAVLEGLPVILAVLNNGYLGMVRQWQELFFQRRYAKTCLASTFDCPPQCVSPGEQCPVYIPDFVALAKAYGALGLRARTMEEARVAIAEAKQTADKPVLIDFLIPREENVWPIVAPGKALHEMVGPGGAL